MGEKSSICNYGEVRFKYMTATPEAMHGVKLKIEKQGMKCHFGRPDRARSCPYERSHTANLTRGKRAGATCSWAKPAAGSRRGELRGRVPMLVAADLRAGEIDRPAGCELLELM